MCAMKNSGGYSKALSAASIRNATLVAAIVIGGSVTPPPARAAMGDVAINGRYTATSLGNWAKTNEAFHDEATVSSTWTLSSSCTTAQDCNGQISSDQGWSAPLYTHDGEMWYVKHDVPNWETCGDGSTNTGHQVFTFSPVDANGNVQTGSSTLAGLDKTVGPSGACRVNKWLRIEMPFRLDKIS
jgi:hypothetical protein